MEDKDTEEEQAYCYWLDAEHATRRLDILGFTMFRARQVFESSIQRYRQEVEDGGCVSGVYWLSEKQLPHQDPPMVDGHQLSKRTRGVVLVQAERPYQSSYVLTALAHAATQQGSSLRKLAGFDFVSGDAFVPVAGVTYGPPSASAQFLRELVRGSFTSQKPTTVILLNGVLSRAPELKRQVLQSHALHHFLVGEGLDFNSDDIGKIIGQSSSPEILAHVSQISDERLGINFSHF